MVRAKKRRRPKEKDNDEDESIDDLITAIHARLAKRKQEEEERARQKEAHVCPKWVFVRSYRCLNERKPHCGSIFRVHDDGGDYVCEDCNQEYNIVVFCPRCKSRRRPARPSKKPRTCKNVVRDDDEDDDENETSEDEGCPVVVTM